jgi:hypothetical protein
MMRQQTALAGASILIALLGTTGCGEKSGASRSEAEATAELTMQGPSRPLGWLGGRARVAADIFTFEHEGERQDCGGMVLKSVSTGGPLAIAGATEGDVIVGVGESWLPIKDDPWLDLIELTETTISSGAEALVLNLRRDGAGVEVELAVGVKTLEEGLPLAVTRFDEGTELSRKRLASQADDAVGTLAWRGLARLAAGAASEEVSLASLSGGRARPDDPALAVSDLIGAVMLEAERLGPLPAEVVAHIASIQEAPPLDEMISMLGDSVQFGDSGSGGGIFGGSSVSFHSDGGDLPANLADLLASGEGSLQVFSIGGGGDEGADPEAMREMLDLPEGAEFSMTSATPEEIAAMFGGEMPEGGSFSFGAPEILDLDTILEEMEPERLGAMEECRRWLDSLVARQADDGSWTDTGADPFRATCDALVALGMAQRAGLDLPAEAVEKAIGYLRPLLHEGEIAAHVATGGDRRDAVVKTLSAVRALEQLGCPETDEFLTLLNRFLKRASPSDFAAPENLLLRALDLRAGGVAEWQGFYDTHRMRLVATQDPDGSFLFSEDLLFSEDRESGRSGAIPDDVVGTLLLALQHARTPLLIGTSANPLAPTIDGFGRRVE